MPSLLNACVFVQVVSCVRRLGCDAVFFLAHAESWVSLQRMSARQQTGLCVTAAAQRILLPSGSGERSAHGAKQTSQPFVNIH